MKFLLKFIEHSSKFSKQFSCHCHYHIFVCLVYQKYTYAQVSGFFFFLKRKGAGTKATPISDNTQKGVEISDEFWCHLKYKHYSKQKAFENFGEGQLRTVKCSIFCILNVDQSCVIWVGGRRRGRREKTINVYFLQVLKCISASYRAGARPIKSLLKVSRNLNRKFLWNWNLLQSYAGTF